MAVVVALVHGTGVLVLVEGVMGGVGSTPDRPVVVPRCRHGGALRSGLLFQPGIARERQLQIAT